MKIPKKGKAIKRVVELQGFSKDHHELLMFALLLNKGIQKEVAYKRIEDYAFWFYKGFINKHFEAEQKIIYPLFSGKDQKDLLSIDARIKESCLSTINNKQKIEALINNINLHVRQQERVLFNQIQESEQKNQIQNSQYSSIQSNSCSLYKDPFWE